jgi:hypothetical protein
MVNIRVCSRGDKIGLMVNIWVFMENLRVSSGKSVEVEEVRKGTFN